MLGNRPLRDYAAALFQREHYVAVFNMARRYPAPVENFFRYLSGNGDYPYDVRVKTPLGLIQPRLDSFHDLLTVNEIFCRMDYVAPPGIRTVVDLGSNIGISALYFLTRNAHARCYLFEPNPRNVAKLKANLAAFSDRYELAEKAVSFERGRVEFGIEPTGRYGGIGVRTGQAITVDCLHINDVLESVLRQAGSIDILKIDTEGAEVPTVEAIDERLALRIRRIYFEGRAVRPLHAAIFSQRQYGSVCQLRNRAFLTEYASC